MSTVDVERTYLELRDRAALRPAPLPPDSLDASLRRERPCALATYRHLYGEVGAAYAWRDRLAWSDEQLASYLERSDVHVWILRVGERIAGYFELVAGDDGSAEIGYFGLLPNFHGRGLGKYLLTRAVEEGWALGAQRVWLHTCTLDDPAAMPNYLARGFTPFRTERYTVELPE